MCSKEKYLKQEQHLSKCLLKYLAHLLFLFCLLYDISIHLCVLYDISMYLCVLPVEARDLLYVFFLYCFLPYLFEIASFTEQGVQGFRQTGWPASTRDPPVPACPALGFRRLPGFLRGLGARACQASLLTELLRRLSVFFLYSFYSSYNWKISWSNTFTQAKRKV